MVPPYLDPGLAASLYCETINFCCLNHLVCGSLLQQLWQTNLPGNSQIWLLAKILSRSRFFFSISMVCYFYPIFYHILNLLFHSFESALSLFLKFILIIKENKIIRIQYYLTTQNRKTTVTLLLLIFSIFQGFFLLLIQIAFGCDQGTPGGFLVPFSGILRSKLFSFFFFF